MKKSTKIILTGVGIAVIVIAAILAILFIKKKNVDASKDGYDIAAEGLNEEFNADVMVYGEDPGFRKSVSYRTVDKITEETLYSAESHKYKAIVLYDYNGKMEISDEELLLIMEYVEEKGYDMFYIGKEYLDDFNRLGFTVGCPEGAYSLEYLGSYKLGQDVPKSETGNMYAEHGLWNERDELTKEKEEIQHRIITLMYDYAKRAKEVGSVK